VQKWSRYGSEGGPRRGTAVFWPAAQAISSGQFSRGLLCTSRGLIESGKTGDLNT